jgi:hypothetical protein
MRLKEQYKDILIYIPLLKKDIVGKFIDVSLYNYLYQKYPDLFEEEIKKKVKNNDISIDNTEFGSGSNIKRKK